MKHIQASLCVYTFLLALASVTVGERETKKYSSVFRNEKHLWTSQNIIREAEKYKFGNGRWDKWERDFRCPSLFGAFPDPTDCSKFYVCNKGRASHKSCSRDKHFDELRRVCLPKFIAICYKPGKTTKEPVGTKATPKDNTFSCPKLMGLFPHPEDCASYYSCVLFIPSLLMCPKNELFDAIKMSCKPADSVHCGNRQRPTTSLGTTVTETTTLEPSTEQIELISTKTEIQTTTEDYQTTTEKTVEPIQITTQEPVTEERTTTMDTTRTETEPTVATTTPFTTTTEIPLSTKPDELTTEVKITKPTGPPETDCDEDDVDCIITETGEVSNWFTCPENMGSHPHPSSDKLFIFCLNWKPSVKRCGQDLVFSKERLTCVAP